MKFSYPEIGGVFDFEKPVMHTLIIEHPAFLYELLTDIRGQIEGNGGKGVLSLNDTPVNMAKYAEILDSFFPFEINRKGLLSKIASALEKNAVQPAHCEKTMQLLRDMEVYLDDLAFDFPNDIVFPKLNISSLIKSVSPELRDEYDSLAEKILDYMELVKEFDGDKLFVTVNLRSFISDRDTALFARTALAHGYNILLVESNARERFELEERLIIDGDLCEIY